MYKEIDGTKMNIFDDISNIAYYSHRDSRI